MRQDPRVLAVGTAVPEHLFSQEEIFAKIREHWGADPGSVALLERLQRQTEVKQRYFSLPLDDYARLSRWGQRNEVWLQTSRQLARQACRRAMEQAGVNATEIGAIFFVSIASIATPSVDAWLAQELGCGSEVRRTPIFGVGCAGGAVGLRQAADFLRAYPNGHTLVVCSELCSLTFRLNDRSGANVVAASLFGDGCAAALLAGAGVARSKLPSATSAVVRAGQSVLYPAPTRDTMGWSISEEGFQVLLSRELPEFVQQQFPQDIHGFLDQQQTSLSDIRHWVGHPGGPKILHAVERSMQLPKEALSRTWEHLRQHGNLSSASVLFVLREFLHEPSRGLGLLYAMGPGFASEYLLLDFE